MLKRLLVLLLAVVVIGAALFTMRNRLSGEFRINPGVKINPKQTYTLKVWIRSEERRVG